MDKSIIMVAALGLVGFLVASNSAVFQDQLFATLYPKQESYASGQAVENEVLVKFDKNIDILNKEKLRAKHNVAVTGEINDIGVERWQVATDKREEILTSLKNEPYLIFAEPNYYLKSGKTAYDGALNIIAELEKGTTNISTSQAFEYSDTLQAAINFASNTGIKVEKID
jgi:hypothetical protein